MNQDEIVAVVKANLKIDPISIEPLELEDSGFVKGSLQLIVFPDAYAAVVVFEPNGFYPIISMDKKSGDYDLDFPVDDDDEDDIVDKMDELREKDGFPAVNRESKEVD